MSFITLLTDFGLKDGTVGVMKGVIWGICPQARIVDISHHIAPQDVFEGAFVLARAAFYFPRGTVHVAVVDPGVGTGRAAVAGQVGEHFFVAPDNGLLTRVLARAQAGGWSVRFVRLENARYWREEISRTFHGRDVFSPVGAHLACGTPLGAFGSPIQADALVRLPQSQPRRLENGWEAHIQYIDVFGNLFTDLPAAWLPEDRRGVRVSYKGMVIEGVLPSYGHAKAGDLVAVINSENWLELAVVNGNAAERLKARTGDALLVELT